MRYMKWTIWRRYLLIRKSKHSISPAARRSIMAASSVSAMGLCAGTALASNSSFPRMPGLSASDAISSGTPSSPFCCEISLSSDNSASGADSSPSSPTGGAVFRPGCRGFLGTGVRLYFGKTRFMAYRLPAPHLGYQVQKPGSGQDAEGVSVEGFWASGRKLDLQTACGLLEVERPGVAKHLHAENGLRIDRVSLCQCLDAEHTVLRPTQSEYVELVAFAREADIFRGVGACVLLVEVVRTGYVRCALAVDSERSRAVDGLSVH